MKRTIKKILKETYEHQVMNDICQKLSTGSNSKSPKFMENLENFITTNDVLPDNIKQECGKIFNRWRSDMWDGVNNERTPNSGTGDSESDESDTYFRQIQSIICSGFMEELD